MSTLMAPTVLLRCIQGGPHSTYQRPFVHHYPCDHTPTILEGQMQEVVIGTTLANAGDKQFMNN